MKQITTKTVIIICAIGLLAGLALGAGILVTSNSINVTVTQQPTPTPTPTPTYTLTLTINGTSATTYSGIVHPSDKLILNATATSVPPGYAAGKTVTFYDNTNHQIGSPVVADANGSFFDLDCSSVN